MNLTHSLERTALILSLIISHKYPSTIFNISNDFKIPIDVVRNDVTKIIYNSFIKSSIYFDVSDQTIHQHIQKIFQDELNTDEMEFIFEEFYNEDEKILLKICFQNALYSVTNKNKINKRIKNLITHRLGYLDYSIISLENNSYFNTYLPIPINAQEEALLQKEFPNLIHSNYHIKNTIWDCTLSNNETIQIINQCIVHKHKLKFDYKKTIIYYPILLIL